MLDIYTFVLKSHWFKCTHNMRWCRVSNWSSQWFEFLPDLGRFNNQPASWRASCHRWLLGRDLQGMRRLRACRLVIRYVSGLVIAAIPMKLSRPYEYLSFWHVPAFWQQIWRTGFLILRAADLLRSLCCKGKRKSGYLSCLLCCLKVFQAQKARQCRAKTAKQNSK